MVHFLSLPFSCHSKNKIFGAQTLCLLKSQDRLDLHRCVHGQLIRADRRVGVTVYFAEHVEQELRHGVDNDMLLVKNRSCC